MDILKKERCKEEIELATERIHKIEEIIKDFENETFRLAVYKAFQEIAEVLTDLAAMILIDRKKTIGDDYFNINIFGQLLNLSKKEIGIIKEANGLRNRVIHKYQEVLEFTTCQKPLVFEHYQEHKFLKP